LYPYRYQAAKKGYFTPASSPLAHSSMGSKYKIRLRKSKALQGRRRTGGEWCGDRQTMTDLEKK